MTPNWFVAWPVNGLSDFIEPLQQSAPGGLDFLHPDDIHITLAFLGKYRIELRSKMLSLLKGLPIRSPQVSTGAVVALPQPRRFSAIAVTLRNGEKEIEQQIERWQARLCREAGAPLDTRRKLPHLTIARPIRRIGADDRAAALEWVESVNASPVSVPLELGEPRLYTWSDRSGESRYRLVDDLPISS